MRGEQYASWSTQSLLEKVPAACAGPDEVALFSVEEWMVGFNLKKANNYK